jgi:hypothetical protein
MYWRGEFAAGRAISADTTYLFLYAYELVDEVDSASALERSWAALVRAFRADDKFASYVASWIVDLRFLSDRYIVDDILAAQHDRDAFLDVQLLAGVTPSWQAVVECFSDDRDDGDRIAGYLSDGHADIAAVDALALSTGPVQIQADYLAGLGTRRGLERLISFRNSRPSFVEDPDFRGPIVALIASARADIGIEASSETDLHFVATASTEVRVPIVRSAIALRRAQAPDTIDGLLETVHHGMDDDAKILLAVVLARSEKLPYVEGRVDADKLLRELFESFAERCGRKATLGAFRHAYLALGRGSRAVWVIDPDVRAAIDIKMGHITARFTKGLQHALYGTNARRRVLDALTRALAKRTGRVQKDLVDALATACGSTSAVLPALQEDEVA